MTKDELAALTPEQKRIRIAEACGFKRQAWCNGAVRPDGAWLGRTEPYKEVLLRISPDYLNDLNDLNACHEMELQLNEAQRYKYVGWLDSITDKPGDAPYWFLLHATAAQRCDAFLLTLG